MAASHAQGRSSAQAHVDASDTERPTLQRAAARAQSSAEKDTLPIEPKLSVKGRAHGADGRATGAACRRDGRAIGELTSQTTEARGRGGLEAPAKVGGTALRLRCTSVVDCMVYVNCCVRRCGQWMTRWRRWTTRNGSVCRRLRYTAWSHVALCVRCNVHVVRMKSRVDSCGTLHLACFVGRFPRAPEPYRPRRCGPFWMSALCGTGRRRRPHGHW